jgi:hypothetical protein
MEETAQSALFAGKMWGRLNQVASGLVVWNQLSKIEVLFSDADNLQLHSVRSFRETATGSKRPATAAEKGGMRRIRAALR